ncbi:MAG: peptide deformylase [Thiotrichaceae bacterium]|nr:peptide deformylase [Thiotrichaceae bacterium]
MTVLNILRYPDTRLRKQAIPVKQVNERVQGIINDMLETMYDAPGIGLAATQVNIHEQIVVIDVSESKDNPLCLVNAKITAQSGTKESEEGCLSVPEYFAKVQRAEIITIEYLDRDGNEMELEADELLAVCIQHELDHLKGKVFIDYLSPLKQSRVRKKLEKAAKQK